MNEDLCRLVHDRLSSDGSLQANWSPLVLAACAGGDTLERFLRAGDSAVQDAIRPEPKQPTGVYLASLTVQGFRGIGPPATLPLTPEAGLTIIIGRNGSGKSSFAEALEVLFTGDSKRWSDRSKVWKEGWRNLHQPHPASIEAEILLEGKSGAKLVATWEEGAPFEAQKVVVQRKGKAKSSLQALGWKDALVSYRPFLSYNELGSLLDEGPSRLYDALSVILGLDDLLHAQDTLARARLERQKAVSAVERESEYLIQELKELLASEVDNRAEISLDALTRDPWQLDAIEKVLAAGVAAEADPDINILTRAATLDSPDAERVNVAVAALRDAHRQRAEVAGSDAESSRQLAQLLESAIAFHAAHGDDDCPVCGRRGQLTETWAAARRDEVARLRAVAAASERAHRAADIALRRARELLAPPPRLLEQLLRMGVVGVTEARERWQAWHGLLPITDLPALATRLETQHEALTRAIEVVRNSAAIELQRREDRWRPIALRLNAFTQAAGVALAAAVDLPRIKAAEKWLKGASAEIRNERFAPIADKAMATWEHLRQQSSVTLGRIELAGTKSQRRVTLDVTVDGVAGAALSVMSQGELHSLALSLFLPRATLSESPFRFVVIDDPVQSMDPARVDGLANALGETAQSRQVIVFTHDERLPEAVRRLGIKSTILSVTRRPRSVVEVRAALVSSGMHS
jgi:energy-coupling factor transporter ATP-binding protein EcfA2